MLAAFDDLRLITAHNAIPEGAGEAHQTVGVLRLEFGSAAVIVISVKECGDIVIYFLVRVGGDYSLYNLADRPRHNKRLAGIAGDPVERQSGGEIVVEQAQLRAVQRQVLYGAPFDVHPRPAHYLKDLFHLFPVVGRGHDRIVVQPENVLRYVGGDAGAGIRRREHDYAAYRPLVVILVVPVVSVEKEFSRHQAAHAVSDQINARRLDLLHAQVADHIFDGAAEDIGALRQYLRGPLIARIFKISVVRSFGK